MDRIEQTQNLLLESGCEAPTLQSRALQPISTSDSKALAYRVVDGKIEWEPDPVFMSADDALAAEAKARQRPRQLDGVSEFLRELLVDRAMWKDHVFERDNKYGFS